jgi:hypothetical protein
MLVRLRKNMPLRDANGHRVDGTAGDVVDVGPSLGAQMLQNGSAEAPAAPATAQVDQSEIETERIVNKQVAPAQPPRRRRRRKPESDA